LLIHGTEEMLFQWCTKIRQRGQTLNFKGAQAPFLLFSA
jgi:hypothetical protein